MVPGVRTKRGHRTSPINAPDRWCAQIFRRQRLFMVEPGTTA